MRKLEIGEHPPEFTLPGVDGKDCSLASFKDKKAVVVIFTCNHCPYVQAYEERLISIQRDYGPKGVQLVAINANDGSGYPERQFRQHGQTRPKTRLQFPLPAR